MAHWVIKLGGSLAGLPALQAWPARIAAAAGQVVVVPGGGPFADTVRKLQQRLDFSDRVAHRMALLAMGQFGELLCSLHPQFVPAASQDAIDLALSQGQVPVWLPAQMLSDAPDIPESWAVTSDSLAAWLAGRLGVSDLLLVKAAGLPAPGSNPAGWAAAGLVDPCLPDFARAAGCQVWIVHQDGSGLPPAFPAGPLSGG